MFLRSDWKVSGLVVKLRDPRASSRQLRDAEKSLFELLTTCSSCKVPTLLTILLRDGGFDPLVANWPHEYAVRVIQWIVTQQPVICDQLLANFALLEHLLRFIRENRDPQTAQSLLLHIVRQHASQIGGFQALIVQNLLQFRTRWNLLQLGEVLCCLEMQLLDEQQQIQIVNCFVQVGGMPLVHQLLQDLGDDQSVQAALQILCAFAQKLSLGGFVENVLLTFDPVTQRQHEYEPIMAKVRTVYEDARFETTLARELMNTIAPARPRHLFFQLVQCLVNQVLHAPFMGENHDMRQQTICDTMLDDCDRGSMTHAQQLDAIVQVYEYIKTQQMYTVDFACSTKDWNACVALVQYWRHTAFEDTRHFAATSVGLFFTSQNNNQFPEPLVREVMDDLVVMVQENKERSKALGILCELVQIDPREFVKKAVFARILAPRVGNSAYTTEDFVFAPLNLTSRCLLCNLIRAYIGTVQEPAAAFKIMNQGMTMAYLSGELTSGSTEIEFHALWSFEQHLAQPVVRLEMFAAPQTCKLIVPVCKYAQDFICANGESGRILENHPTSRMASVCNNLLHHLESFDLPQEHLIDLVLSVHVDMMDNANPLTSWLLLCRLTTSRPMIRDFVLENSNVELIELLLTRCKPFHLRERDCFALFSGLLLSTLIHVLSRENGDDAAGKDRLVASEELVAWLNAILASHRDDCSRLIPLALRVVKLLVEKSPASGRLDRLVGAVNQVSETYVNDDSILRSCQDIRTILHKERRRILYHQTTSLRAADAEGSVLQHLQDLQRDDTETKRRAIKTLRRLNKISFENGRDMVHQGVLPLLLSFWQECTNSEDQVLVVRLVNSLANNIDTAIAMAHQHEFLTTLVEIAKVADSTKNYWVWSCVRHFSKHPNTVIQRELLQSEILELLSALSESPVHDHFFSWRDCCIILQHMSRHNNTDAARMEIARRGGISFVFQALNQQDTSVRQAGLLVLSELMKTKQVADEFDLPAKFQLLASSSDEMVQQLAQELTHKMSKRAASQIGLVGMENDILDWRSPRSSRESYEIPRSSTCLSSSSDETSSIASSSRITTSARSDSRSGSGTVSIPELITQLELGDLETKRRAVKMLRNLCKIRRDQLGLDMVNQGVLKHLFAFWKHEPTTDNQLIAVRLVNSLANHARTAVEMARQEVFLSSLLDLAQVTDGETNYWAWSCLRNFSKHADSEIQRALLNSRVLSIASVMAGSSAQEFTSCWRDCCGVLQNMGRHNTHETRLEIARRGGISFALQALTTGDANLQAAALMVLREFLTTKEVVVEFILPNITTLECMACHSDETVSSLGRKVLALATVFQQKRNSITESPLPPAPVQEQAACCTVNGRTFLIKSTSLHGRNLLLEAADTFTHKPVMIKIYKDQFSSHASNEVQKLSGVLELPNSRQFVVEAMDFSEEGSYQRRTCSALVMQCGQKNLKEVVEKYARVSILEYASTIMKGIAKCLLFLHAEAKIVHADIKLENVVNFGDGFGIPQFKLIDFENSQYMNEALQLDCSPEYCPPELAMQILMRDRHRDRSPSLCAAGSFDVWCFGVMWMKYLVQGRGLIEFQDLTADAMLKCISKPGFNFEKSLVSLGSDVSRPMKELIRKCTQRDPDCRPTFAEILKDPVLGGYNTTHWRESSMQDKLRDLERHVQLFQKQRSPERCELTLPVLCVLVPWQEASARHMKTPRDWSWTTLGDQAMELRFLCDAIMDEDAVVPCCRCAEQHRIRIHGGAQILLSRAMPVLRCGAVVLQISSLCASVMGGQTSGDMVHNELVLGAHQILSQGFEDDRSMGQIVESIDDMAHIGKTTGFPQNEETKELIVAKLRHEGRAIRSCFESEEPQLLLRELLQSIVGARNGTEPNNIGGLYQVQDKTGRVRWVCASHAERILQAEGSSGSTTSRVPTTRASFRSTTAA